MPQLEPLRKRDKGLLVRGTVPRLQPAGSNSQHESNCLTVQLTKGMVRDSLPRSPLDQLVVESLSPGSFSNATLLEQKTKEPQYRNIETGSTMEYASRQLKT